MSVSDHILSKHNLDLDYLHCKVTLSVVSGNYMYCQLIIVMTFDASPLQEFIKTMRIASRFTGAQQLSPTIDHKMRIYNTIDIYLTVP